MMYSCALWSDEEGGINGDFDMDMKSDGLEKAQLRKLHYVCKQARLRPGHRVLEFGTGWGGFAILVDLTSQST